MTLTNEQLHYLNCYGRCVLEDCKCAKEGLWRGIGCEYWETLGAMSDKDLIEMMRERYRQSKEVCGNE